MLNPTPDALSGFSIIDQLSQSAFPSITRLIEQGFDPDRIAKVIIRVVSDMDGVELGQSQNRRPLIGDEVISVQANKVPGRDTQWDGMISTSEKEVDEPEKGQAIYSLTEDASGKLSETQFTPTRTIGH